MRVLLVTYAFSPLVTPRAIQLARLVKYLTRMKIRVHVLAAEPRFTSEIRDPALMEIYRPEEGCFRVTRTPTLESRYLSFGLGLIHPGLNWLPDPKAGWRPFAARAASRLIAKSTFDVVMTCSLPYTSHLVGLYLKERFGLPWVAHLSDPWTLSPYIKFLGPRHQRLARGWERSVFTKADGVVFVSRTTLDAYRSLYPFLETKGALVPHCFDPEERGAKPGEDLAEGSIVHVGNFYGLRSPATFFEALAGLDTDELRGVRFIFAGRVSPRDLSLARRLGLGDLVEFLGPVPYRDAAALAGSARAFLLIDGPGPGKSHFFPSKLVDYLARARPILGITPEGGEAARVLHRFGQPTAQPDDAAQVRGLLRRGLARDIEPPDMREVSALYSASRTAARMAEIFAQALEG